MNSDHHPTGDSTQSEKINANDVQNDALKDESTLRLLERLAAAERDILAGRVISHVEAKKRLAKWLK